MNRFASDPFFRLSRFLRFHLGEQAEEKTCVLLFTPAALVLIIGWLDVAFGFL